MTEDGDPILADIGKGKFQVTHSYFEAAVSRVPIQNRAQYLTLEGKRDFLEKLVVESTFYLEGVRRKFFKKKAFRKSLRLHSYGAVNELAKVELLKDIKLTDEQVRAEYDRVVKDKEKYPFAEHQEDTRHRLLGRMLDNAYNMKKRELAKEWGVKIDFELLSRFNVFQSEGKKDWPKLEETIATGQDYQYTVGNLLMRLDETPPETRKLLRKHPNPKKVVEYIIGEDIIHTWVKREGWDSGPEFETRKKIVEVGTLSRVTREEILGEDIKASSNNARAYYEAHKDELSFGGDPPPFDSIRDVMIERATEELRVEATRSLAQSLTAHRYPVVYFEPNIKQYLQ
ncbi:MAG: hypothetical protein P9L99_01680 [Candidatus Lernaella stagnicola]|nr:hypothetical protein [Candidatus Lernaella stagnicola]